MIVDRSMLEINQPVRVQLVKARVKQNVRMVTSVSAFQARPVKRGVSVRKTLNVERMVILMCTRLTVLETVFMV